MSTMLMMRVEDGGKFKISQMAYKEADGNECRLGDDVRCEGVNESTLGKECSWTTLA